MSTLPSDLPKLAKWPFFLADALLLATAAAIAWNHSGRLSGLPFYIVAGCVALAAILGTLPLLADYARSQDQALDDRQRALEALARSVAASAEQMGIVAAGMNGIVERSQKALVQSEELAKALQKKVADAQQQIESAHQEEMEELERELATLRSSEADRLESSVEKIHKIAAELVKLESSASKHLSLSAEAIAKAHAVADGAAGKLAQVADESAAKMGAALDRTLHAAQESSKAVLGEEQKRLLDAIGDKLDATLAALDAQSSKTASTIDAKIATLEAVVANLKAAVAEASRLHTSQSPRPPRDKTSETRSETDATTDGGAEAPHAAKRVRKISQAADDPADPKPEARSLSHEEAPAAASAAHEPSPEKIPQTAAEALEAALPPVPAQAPSAQPISDPSAVAHAKVPSASVASPGATTQTKSPLPSDRAEALDAPPSFVELPSTPKKTKSDNRDEPSLDFGDFDQSPQQETVASTALSADGATRLIVTAYIGIGNRLYIRGEGPGLSWERGVALQFVSIGKWRWESAEASGPVQFKLYKNDQTECSSLGRLTLQPGHQAEVTANF